MIYKGSQMLTLPAMITLCTAVVLFDYFLNISEYCMSNCCKTTDIKTPLLFAEVIDFPTKAITAIWTTDQSKSIEKC